jgi:hypothetical protein
MPWPSPRKAFSRFIDSIAHTKEFTPERKEELFAKYRDSLGLGPDVNFGATAFADYEKNKVQNHTGFKTVIRKDGENDVTLETLLKGDLSADPNKSGVADALKNVFAQEGFYQKAKEAYEEEIAQIQKKIVKEVPIPHSIDVVRSALKAAQDDAKKAIEAQQKTELSKLKKAFDTPSVPAGFLDKFKATTGVADLTQLKKDMIAELEDKHKGQLKAFEDAAATNQTVIDKASAAEKGHLIFTAHLEKYMGNLSQSKQNRMNEELARVRLENREKLGLDKRKAVASADLQDKTIAAVNPNDLKYLISVTGREITHDNGVWRIEMPPRILAPFYYGSLAQNPKAEWMTMANAIRASGFDGIKMVVNFDDPETQKQRAREAYEAALDNGFDPGPLNPPTEKPSGITLVDGKGVEINPNTLFSHSELTLLHSKAQTTRDKLKNIEANVTSKTAPEPSAERIKDFRDQLLAGRNAERTSKGLEAATEAHKDEISRVLSTS